MLKQGFGLGLVTLACIAICFSSVFPASAAEGDELGSILDSLRQDVENERVNVASTLTGPGSPQRPGSSNRQNSADPIAHIPVAPKPPKPTHPFDNRCVEWTSLDECLRLTPQDADPVEDDTTTPATPTFTITDLASFGPAPATLTGEPDNLGVAGLPTNFTADAAAHTRNGTLFGYPITARFTPTTFTFHYGDGETRKANTGGASWYTLGLPQFAPTDTSHTYTQRGTYTAHADTTYTAEINLGTGWIPITGTLTIPGPTQDIRIYQAHTALVAHTCTENPTGPGC